MKDRIRVLWAIGRLRRKHPEIKHTFRCTEDGCGVKISTLRFLRVGCICKMHLWVRRWSR